MIEVNTAPGQQNERFQNYDDLFDHIIEMENLKMLELEPDFRTMQWSFVAYAPHHVTALYMHLKGQDKAIKEASEKQLPLIEICTGDFTKPEYVVGTQTLNLGYLKKKWALAYCATHNMTIAPSCGS